MRALFYLFQRSVRNFFFQLVKKPARLVGYLVILLLLVFVIAVSVLEDSPVMENLRPIKELYGLVFALYLFGIGVGLQKGLSTGGTFFSMADVNLLFCSPLSPKKILVYGLMRQAGMTVLMGAVLLFQAANLRNVYGCGLGVLLLIFVGYVLTQLSSELVAVVLYAVTSGNEPRRKRVKIFVVLFFLPLAAGMIWNCLIEGMGITGVTQTLSSDFSEMYPFAGWMKGLVSSLLDRDYMMCWVYGGAFVLLFSALVFFLCRYRVDYYEDVLLFSQEKAQIKEQAKNGGMGYTEKVRKSQKVRLGNGLKGKGARAVFYKHLLENRRTGFWMFDLITVTQVGSCLFFLLILKVTFGEEAVAAELMTSLFAFSVYMQMMTSGTGRWGKELSRPFLFLIPDRPSRKLLYACGESLWKNTLEGVPIFIIGGLLVGADPVSVLACILGRAGFSILFISGSLLMERLFGEVTSKGLMLLLYFLFMMVLSVPGLIGGLFLSVVFTGQTALYTVVLFDFLINLALASLILFLCRNLLHEINISGAA